MKYSFEARFELARRLSATFQRSASNFSIPARWSAINLYLFLSLTSCFALPEGPVADEMGHRGSQENYRRLQRQSGPRPFPMKNYVWGSWDVPLPKAHGESILFLNELRVCSIVVMHQRDDFIPYAHAAGVNIAVVAHNVNQGLVAGVAHS